MILELPDLKINVDFFRTVKNDKPTLLFLHGFTGSSDEWKTIALGIDQNFSSAAIDLIGHGKTDSPSDLSFYSADAIANQLKGIITQYICKKVVPVGYSMGGRAALTFSVKYPDMIEGLVLESATPGFKDETLRQERIKKDEGIAEYILTHSLEEFAEFWMNMEIFNTQRRFSEEKRNQIRQNKLMNNPLGLANSLRGFGTGTMSPLFDQLVNIKCKTFLITGELDSKFTQINSEIVNLFPDAEHKIVNNAGHNAHLEEPGRFIKGVNNYLQSLINS